jgi:hypothetical protein
MKLKNFERLRAKSIMIDGGFTFAVIFATTHLADLCMKLLGEDILAEKREGLSYQIAWLSISITYMLNKDLINGRSIGKTLTNFRVVRISDGLTAGPWRCLLRNLPTLLVPLEVIMLFISYRRLGDYLAHTRIDEAPEKYELKKFDGKRFLKRLFVVAITFVSVFGVMWMINNS